MQKRVLGKTGVAVSALGFGCMRFPIVEEENRRIDREKSEKLLLKALEGGVNYFDTAYPYHYGESESFLGDFVSKYDIRSKVYIATKLPSWKIEKQEDFELYFEEQLQKLQTDYIDFYLVHALNKSYWDNLVKAGLFPFLTKLKAEKRVSFIGFSFHDDFALFRTIVDSYDWDFCQIQYNYVDIDYQAGRKGLLYAARKGLGIIIMEPLRGGKLARNIPPEVLDVFRNVKPDRTPAEWAFRFLLANPAVHLILSGMSTMEEVSQNLSIFSENGGKKLTSAELEAFQEARKQYLKRVKIPCTACYYCLPCPQLLKIPDMFEFYNDAFIFNDVETSRTMYQVFLDVPASECRYCGICEKKCPQNISIRKELKNVIKVLENEK